MNRYHWLPGATHEDHERIRSLRQRLRQEIRAEIGDLCECCNRLPWTDLHEVWVRRSAVPVAKQHEIMIRGNCAGTCIACHRADMGSLPLAETQAFKDRFEQRLRILGHTPIIDWWVF